MCLNYSQRILPHTLRNCNETSGMQFCYYPENALAKWELNKYFEACPDEHVDTQKLLEDCFKECASSNNCIGVELKKQSCKIYDLERLPSSFNDMYFLQTPVDKNQIQQRFTLLKGLKFSRSSSDFKPITAQTSKECLEVCYNLESCSKVSFDSKTKECYLGKFEANLEFDENAVLFVKLSPVNSFSLGFNRVFGSSVVGNDMKETVHAYDANMPLANQINDFCLRECLKTKECHFVTASILYSSREMKCYLKSENGDSILEQTDPNLISYIKKTKSDMAFNQEYFDKLDKFQDFDVNECFRQTSQIELQSRDESLLRKRNIILAF